MSVGFPIADSSGVGTSPADARKILSAHWASFGVVTGGTVSTSSTGLTYTVAPGVGVGSRGTTYGAVEFLIPSGSVTTTAGPSSGSRIDVVYALPQDPSQGDASADVILGVVNGTAASSPTKPGVPTGAVELGAFLVPQSMWKTSQATAYGDQVYAIPYGASLGVLVDVKDTTSGVPSNQSPSSAPWRGSSKFYLPTSRYVEVSLVIPMQSKGDEDDSGSLTIQFRIDGQIAYEEMFAYSTTRWDTARVTYAFLLSAGSHTVAYKWAKGSANMPDIRLVGTGKYREGVVFRVRDLGVAA